MLLRPLFADACFDQDFLLARVHEHAIHVHADAVFLVGWTDLRPELTRNDAEHRPSIETKFGVLNHRHGVVANLHCTYRKSRSEEHTSELQSPCNIVCRLLLET